MRIFTQAIEFYIDIQKSTKPHIDPLIKLGVSDWRIANFPSLYKDLIDDHVCMSQWGISSNELKNLYALEEKLTKQCDHIDSFGLSPTLNHSDIQTNNMLITSSSDFISIIDWGEVSIGHPLLSLKSCFHATAGRFGFTTDADQFTKLRKFCFALWNITGADYNDLSNAIEPVSTLYYAFTLHALINSISGDMPQCNNRGKNSLLKFAERLHA